MPVLILSLSTAIKRDNVHSTFLGKKGLPKQIHYRQFFPKPDGNDKLYKLSSENQESTREPHNSDLMETSSDDSQPTDVESSNQSIIQNEREPATFLSLKFHDYGGCITSCGGIAHKAEQIEPVMISVSTQTDEISDEKHVAFTQTISSETCSVGIQVNKPDLTFEDIENNDEKVLFYTGVPDAKTFSCLFNELENGMESKFKSGRPRAMRLIDEFFMVFTTAFRTSFR